MMMALRSFVGRDWGMGCWLHNKRKKRKRKAHSITTEASLAVEASTSIVCLLVQ
jgi:hypothetical protein